MIDCLLSVSPNYVFALLSCITSGQVLADIACDATTRPAYVYNDTNIIESQNFPGDYPLSSYCQWIITPVTNVNVSRSG